jgi:hypothetical protein
VSGLDFLDVIRICGFQFRELHSQFRITSLLLMSDPELGLEFAPTRFYALIDGCAEFESHSDLANNFQWSWLSVWAGVSADHILLFTPKLPETDEWRLASPGGERLRIRIGYEGCVIETRQKLAQVVGRWARANP